MGTLTSKSRELDQVVVEKAPGGPFRPLQKQFPADFAFEARLRSALTVENCSQCAQTEVCSDVVNAIVEMLTPHMATFEELDAANVSWKYARIAVERIAKLEMKEGKVLGEGYYLRAAIAHFGNENWLKVCVNAVCESSHTTFGALFCCVQSKVLPNATTFALTIPPSGHPLRKKALAPSNPRIFKNFPGLLATHTAVRRSDKKKCALLCSLERFIGCAEDWDRMLLWQSKGAIAAVQYLARFQKKVDNSVFIALLPRSTRITDAGFWTTHSPKSLLLLNFHSKKFRHSNVMEEFKAWIGPEATNAVFVAGLERYIRERQRLLWR